MPTPYNDSAGYATIGFGHLLHYSPVTSADRDTWGTLTVESGLELLRDDAAAATAAVSHGVHVRLGVIPARAQARFDALCSLAFNIGAAAFESSTVLRLVNEHGAPRDWHPVATAMLAWSHAGGVLVPGLLNRRKIEAAVILSGRISLAP